MSGHKPYRFKEMNTKRKPLATIIDGFGWSANNGLSLVPINPF